MLPWPNHLLCSEVYWQKIIFKNQFLSLKWLTFTRNQVWGFYFSRPQKPWNSYTSCSNGFFHASLASIISRQKCARPLNGYCTTAHSWKQLWFEQTSEYSKGALTWKLRERAETVGDGGKSQRQRLVEQHRYPRFSTGSKVLPLQRHLAHFVSQRVRKRNCLFFFQ